jgi:hypothetical protein
MDEHSKPDQLAEEDVVELTEESRREFITKLIAAAGAVAAASFVAGGPSAGADLHKVEGKVEYGKVEYDKVEALKDVVTLKYGKVRSGFRLSMSGRQLGTALNEVGLLQPGANLDNASITIEFTA